MRKTADKSSEKHTICVAELCKADTEAIPVSVIIPVYNVKQYLSRCLNSVLAQTHKNLEIILVDDGSTDNSTISCDEYCLMDNRIKVVHQYNMGQSSARNIGIKFATGEYAVFIDSDDSVLPEYIHIMMSAAKIFHADIIQTLIKIVNSEDNGTIHNDENVKIQLYQPGKNAINSMKYKVSPCAKLYRSAIVKDNPFPLYSAYEDDASYYRFAYEAKQICILNYHTYLYFQTKSSVMRCPDKVKNQNIDYISVYYDRIDFFTQKGEKDLILGTRNRFCLILMLSFASYRKNGTNKKDMPQLLEIFKEQYALLKGYRIGAVRRSEYILFRYFPDFTAKLIGILRK